MRTLRREAEWHHDVSGGRSKMCQIIDNVVAKSCNNKSQAEELAPLITEEGEQEEARKVEGEAGKVEAGKREGKQGRGRQGRRRGGWEGGGREGGGREDGRGGEAGK